MKDYIILDNKKQKRCKKCKKYTLIKHFRWPYTKTCIKCVYSKFKKKQ